MADAFITEMLFGTGQRDRSYPNGRSEAQRLKPSNSDDGDEISHTPGSGSNATSGRELEESPGRERRATHRRSCAHVGLHGLEWRRN